MRNLARQLRNEMYSYRDGVELLFAAAPRWSGMWRIGPDG
jgi:hypothetical protein